MATYTQIIYHIVYSTKYRKPTLLKPNRERLFKFLWGVLNKQNCHLYRINGVEYHMHILNSLHPAVSLADIVKDLKLAGTFFIKEKSFPPGFNGWQTGYGAFIHSKKDKNRLIDYIQEQENHYRHLSFKEELTDLFDEYGIKFKETYFD